MRGLTPHESSLPYPISPHCPLLSNPTLPYPTNPIYTQSTPSVRCSPTQPYPTNPYPTLSTQSPPSVQPYPTLPYLLSHRSISLHITLRHIIPYLTITSHHDRQRPPPSTRKDFSIQVILFGPRQPCYPLYRIRYPLTHPATHFLTPSNPPLTHHLTTGDLGRVNPATGDVLITGREKDTIVLRWVYSLL